MNQAASATRRPAGSIATAGGCCPMFNASFFLNTFAPQAPILPTATAQQQCYVGRQAPHLSLPLNQTQHQNVAPAQPVNPQLQQGAPLNGPAPQQAPAQQQQPQRPQDHSNTYNTSPIVAPTLSLQHLLANRNPASNCVALAAAAIASTSFPHFQQLQQAQQQQQQLPPPPQTQTPINQSTTNNSTSTAANPVPPSSATAATINQVPLLNFNNFSTAQQPFLNLPTPAAMPATAHLNSSNHTNHHQSIAPNVAPSSQPTVAQATSRSNITNHQSVLQHHQQNGQHHQRPLATNTTLNSAANHAQPSNYRHAPSIRTPPSQAPIQPQQPSAQQLNQATRSTLNADALNSLFTDQFQTILLNQLLASNQFASPVNTPVQPQQTAAAPINSSRPGPNHISLPGQAPVVMPPTQQVGAPNIAQQPSLEPVSGQQQASQQQAHQPRSTAQSRIAQVPNVDSYTPGVGTSSLYQQQQPIPQVNHQQQNSQSTESSLSQHLQQPNVPQTQPLQQQPQQPLQQTQPVHPFYPVPQMEQALALLANPQVANNIFHFMFNMYQQNNLGTDPHHSHHHHHSPHHYHHHLHGSHHHHHHHHGPNNQGNGQDVSPPLDSMAISESKPKGLTRAEIDSLTPYIQLNEKDSRTCVICLSKFELKSKIRPLPCNHAFHAKCVDKWLRANRSCPICRRDALKTHGAKIKRV